MLNMHTTEITFAPARELDPDRVAKEFVQFHKNGFFVLLLNSKENIKKKNSKKIKNEREKNKKKNKKKEQNIFTNAPSNVRRAAAWSRQKGRLAPR